MVMLRIQLQLVFGAARRTRTAEFPDHVPVQDLLDSLARHPSFAPFGAFELRSKAGVRLSSSRSLLEQDVREHDYLQAVFANPQPGSPLGHEPRRRSEPVDLSQARPLWELGIAS